MKRPSSRFGCHVRTLLCTVSMLVLFAATPAAAQEFPLCLAVDDASEVIAVAGGSGAAIFVWVDERADSDHPMRLYAQKVDVAGVPMWTTDGVPLAIGIGDQVAAGAASDGAGGVIVAWADNRSLPASPNVYAQRLDATGTALWGAGGFLAATTTTRGLQSPVAVAPDGMGGAYLMFESDGAGTGVDLWAQRLSPAGARLWGAPGLLVCGAPGNQVLPRVVLSPTGTPMVVWEDDRAGGVSDPYAQRFTSGGIPLWTAGGVPVTTSFGLETKLAAIPDGSNGLVVVWEDDRSLVGTDIYAQRLSGSGAPLWDGPEPGPDLLLSGAAGDQCVPRVARGLPGPFVVGWIDSRTETWDIYAQAVLGDGTLLWSPDGRPISTAPGAQWLRTVTAGSGEATLFLWQDERDPVGVSEIYGQLVTTMSEDVWEPDGRLLAEAPLAQRLPAGLATGSETAVFAWEDGRSGTQWDLYVSAQSTSVSAPEPTPGHFQSLTVVPNPTRERVDLRVRLAGEQRVSITVYDTRGRMVRRLYDGTLGAGERSVAWDGREDGGRRAPAGVYFARVTSSGGEALFKRVVLMR